MGQSNALMDWLLDGVSISRILFDVKPKYFGHFMLCRLTVNTRNSAIFQGRIKIQKLAESALNFKLTETLLFSTKMLTNSRNYQFFIAAA